MQDSAERLVLRLVQGSYEGKVSIDGNSITGTRIHGSPQAPIFQNATKATAWTLDTSLHTVPFVSVEPGVKLEVLDWVAADAPSHSRRYGQHRACIR
jgi:hypothetical protein